MFNPTARARAATAIAVVTTGLLIPIEIYEIQRHFTITKAIVLAVNVAIVWYLVRRVRTR